MLQCQLNFCLVFQIVLQKHFKLTEVAHLGLEGTNNGLLSSYSLLTTETLDDPNYHIVPLTMIPECCEQDE